MSEEKKTKQTVITFVRLTDAEAKQVAKAATVTGHEVLSNAVRDAMSESAGDGIMLPTTYEE